MKKNKIEIKWAITFVVMILIWMFLEKMAGLQDEHIDKHSIYTNFIAIPAIAIYVFALLDKRKNFFKGAMTYNYRNSYCSKPFKSIYYVHNYYS